MISFQPSLFCLFYFIFFLYWLYNIVLVLPYINMNLPRVYTCSQSWALLPPPSPYHLSRSSQCTSSKHPVSCIGPGLAISFLYDIIHVSMPFSQISHFLIGSFIFLELSCKSCLYIFEINSLSVASFAIIFSHSESCFFSLLIVSFVVQKLLNLIMSHLFIFVFISISLGDGSKSILLRFMSETVLLMFSRD